MTDQASLDSFSESQQDVTEHTSSGSEGSIRSGRDGSGKDGSDPCDHEDTIERVTSGMHYPSNRAPKGEIVTWCKNCHDVVDREVIT